MTRNIAPPSSAWPFASAWLSVTADEFGLNPNPATVHHAPDGQKAIDFIDRAETDPQAPAPHCLLLDLNLPGKGGFEVLQRLRASARFKSVPVLIFTSSDSPSDRKQAAELGAGYYRKPPSYVEFLKLGGVLKRVLNDSGAI